MANSYNELFGLGTHSEDAALEGWWKLQETTGTSAVDSSSNGRNGTINGMGSNPVTITGPNNWLPSAFDFDGTDDNVSLPTTAAIGGDAARTYLVWVRADGDNTDEIIYQGNAANTSNRQIRLQQIALAPGRLRLEVQGTGVSTALSFDANWVLVSLRKGTPTADVFRLGLNDSFEDWSRTVDTATEFFYLGEGLNSGRRWDGGISGAASFSRALTDAEVAEYRLGPEPIFTVNPTLSGTATVGETLSSTTGTAQIDQTEFPGLSNGTVTYSYQWTRSDDNTGTNEADIVGATSSTYTLVAGDIGKFIRCRVRASNLGGFDPAQDTNTAFSAEVTGGGAPEGNGTASLELDAAGAGQSITNGFGVAAFVLDATGVGERIATGSGTAPIELDAAGVGDAPTVGVADGFGVATLELDAAGVGEATYTGFGIAALELDAAGVGQLPSDLEITSLTVTTPSSLAIRITGTTSGNRIQYVIQNAPGSEPAVDATPTGFADVTPNQAFTINVTGLTAGNKRVWARAVDTGS